MVLAGEAALGCGICQTVLYEALQVQATKASPVTQSLDVVNESLVQMPISAAGEMLSKEHEKQPPERTYSHSGYSWIGLLEQKVKMEEGLLHNKQSSLALAQALSERDRAQSQCSPTAMELGSVMVGFIAKLLSGRSRVTTAACRCRVSGTLTGQASKSRGCGLSFFSESSLGVKLGYKACPEACPVLACPSLKQGWLYSW